MAVGQVLELVPGGVPCLLSRSRAVQDCTCITSYQVKQYHIHCVGRLLPDASLCYLLFRGAIGPLKERRLRRGALFTQDNLANACFTLDPMEPCCMVAHFLSQG